MYRVSRELCELEENELRFLWCDGFDPQYLERDARGTWMAGETWMGAVSRWAFRLRLGAPDAEPPADDWEPLLPGQEQTDWLYVDLPGRYVEVHPPATSPPAGRLLLRSDALTYIRGDECSWEFAESWCDGATTAVGLEIRTGAQRRHHLVVRPEGRLPADTAYPSRPAALEAARAQFGIEPGEWEAPASACPAGRSW